MVFAITLIITLLQLTDTHGVCYMLLLLRERTASEQKEATGFSAVS